MEEIVYRSPRERLVAAGTIELFERDMTATIAADVSLARVQEKLATVGQWLAVDGDPNRSVGDLVSTNSSGPLRLGYGAWRDLLLGAQFTNGLGELITAGGRVMKNVAGYDLTKLMVGQHGVLGTLQTISTRTYRRPAGAIVAALDASEKKLGELIAGAIKPQWAMLAAGEMLCGYLGDETALAYYEKELLRAGTKSVQRRSLEEDIAHRAELWRFDTNAVLEMRASLPPARVVELVKSKIPARWVADAAFGIVLASFENAGDVDVMKKLANELGGTFITSRRGELIEADYPAAERSLLERLKQAFDPDGKLSPLPWKVVSQ